MMKSKIFVALLAIVLALSSCAASPGEKNADSERPQLIAHAGGAIWGYRYTNSLEAINTAYANGFRYIELDFELTSDGSVVLIHDWEAMGERMLFSEGVRTSSEFLSAPTFMGLTLLDAAGLKKWMESHEDAYIISDVKASHNAAVLRKLRDELGDASARIIPQIYSLDEYDAVTSLGFENVILTVYRMGIDERELSEFVGTHKLWALTAAYSRLTEELLQAAGDIPVYAHTVNTLGDFESWRLKGLSGIYTDYFIPDHWPYK